MADVSATIDGILNDIEGRVERSEHRGLSSYSVSAENLVQVCTALRDNADTSFEQLLEVTAVDWYNKRTPRYMVVYILYSLTHKYRIKITVDVAEDSMSVPSLTSVWESANWYERETYDMYGVTFENHPDLRRFFLPEDFTDPETGEPLYPLRKDFPLMGIPGSLPLPDKEEPK